MLTVEQAQKKILGAISPITHCECVSLLDSYDRVLAEDAIALTNAPSSDNSAMDGYAIHTDDVTIEGTALLVSQRIPAGTIPTPLTKGTAARIFTGAAIPENANAVVIQENTTFDTNNNHVTFLKTASPNDNIRPLGQDVKLGRTVLPKGTKIDARHIALLATAGISKVNVTQKIRIAVLSTGDELLEPGETPEPGKIFNSNKPMLTSLLTRLNCDITELTCVDDTLEATQRALTRAERNADLIITTGGVSVGEEDHVKPAVEALGTLSLWKIQLKPGKPVAFGKVGQTPFMGLPGNPVSSFVTFLLFCKPVIEKLQNQLITPITTYKTHALFSIDKPRSRREYMRVLVTDKGAEKFTNQSSGVMSSVTWCNALAIIPVDTIIEHGDLIDVIPLTGQL